MTSRAYYGSTRKTWRQRLDADPALRPKIVELYTVYEITCVDLAKRYSTNPAEIKKLLTEAGVKLRHGRTF